MSMRASSGVPEDRHVAPPVRGSMAPNHGMQIPWPLYAGRRRLRDGGIVNGVKDAFVERDHQAGAFACRKRERKAESRFQRPARG